MTDQTLPCRDEMLDAFVKWRKDYALTVEPNYSAATDYDCWSAWQAAWKTRAQASAPEGGEAVGYITDEPNHVARFTERGHRLPPGTPLYTRSNAKAGEDALDAARYRFLKEGNPGPYNMIMLHAGTALDEAIDAAIATQRGDGSEMVEA